jgi:hypothetical protein
VYSENSGFTLRNGRSARIYLEGNFAGEWETGDAARYADEFDSWVMEREAVIAKRMRDAYYDKYYDRDIYGAEDLNEYGEWIYTRKYGYVWKPFSTATAGYANWSPYRYGHWRWVPVYGWTWVNDEPWGWATYHHGRWVWDNGYWVWTPYGYYRWRRSWWSPGLVVVTWNGSLICWYPLPYDSHYYDYNRHYYSRHNRRRNNTTIINNNTTVVVVNPTPSPNPNPSPTPPVVQNPTNEDRRNRLQTPTFQRVPLNGVVAMKADEFGRDTKGTRSVPLDTAKTILSKTPDERNQTPPILPDYKDISRQVSKEILIENPRPVKSEQVKTGVTERKSGVPLDEELRKVRIFGNRTPVQPTRNEEVKSGVEMKPDRNETRKTGAVTRPVFKPDEGDTQPTDTPTKNPRNDFPTRTTGDGNSDDNDRKNDQRPVFRPRQRDENQTPPIYVPPPPKQEERRQQPKNNDTPRSEPPKQRDEPRQTPQPKSEPKSEPKNDSKPTQPSVIQRKTEKDG